MKKISFLSMAIVALFGTIAAQNSSAVKVPTTVKQAFLKKYPGATKVTWEREKGNFEANYGGKSGEDTSVVFTPGGAFVEEVDAIPVKSLPASVGSYVKAHYNGAKITEAGHVTDASGKTSFEAEIKGKDLIFDESGNFVKVD
jgi:hypothetical protein